MSQSKERPPRIVTTGYTTLDVIRANGSIRHHAGGTAANIAADLAWLGLPVHLLARIGNDGPGRAVHSELQSAGVALDLLVRDPDTQTPLVVHDVRADGSHRFMFSCPVCRRPFPRYRPVSTDQATEAIELAPEVLLIDRANRPALLVAEATRDSGGLVIFEPNTRGRPELTREAVRVAHIVKTTRQRASELGHLLRPAGSGQVQIRSAGSKGAYWRIGTGEWQHEPAFAFAAKVVDAAGAGDWLSAGLLASLPRTRWRERAALREAIRFGQALAGLACQHVGARGLNRDRSRSEVLREIQLALRWRTNGASPEATHRVRRAANTCRGCLRSEAA